MKSIDFRVIGGALLVVAGALALLQTLTGQETMWGWVWAFLFALVGLTFLALYANTPTRNWWAIIPGITLVALSALIGLSLLGFGDDTVEGTWLGAFFLGSIGLSFWIVYLTRREFWWAVIPGGTLFTLAVVALMSIQFQDEVVGAVFFFGLAVTFALLYFLPIPHVHTAWVLIPAVGLVVMGLAVLLAYTNLVNYIWSSALILIGIYLLFRQRGGGEMTRKG